MAAVLAATIGAVSLHRQLAHSKRKAADEAWWQQFEWATDRIITPASGATALPTSLAFDLTNSLYRSAQAQFQNDAIDGILKHYFKEFEVQEEPASGRAQASTFQGREIDEVGASSLRSLIGTLPHSSTTSAQARRVLEGYEYEQEVRRALRHQGFLEIDALTDDPSRADGLFAIGPKRFAIELKSYSPSSGMITMASRQLKHMMSSMGVEHGVLITRPRAEGNGPDLKSLAAEGIHLVEWEPRMRSWELKSQIQDALS